MVLQGGYKAGANFLSFGTMIFAAFETLKEFQEVYP